MRINVKVNSNLGKIEVGEIIRIWLFNSSEAMIERAQELAPYETGTLKKSIGREPAKVTANTRKLKIGPRKVPYAVMREFVNYKNPDRRFYMKKTYGEAKEIIEREFAEAAKIVTKKV